MTVKDLIVRLSKQNLDAEVQTPDGLLISIAPASTSKVVYLTDMSCKRLHPLTPTGDAHRDTLVSERLNVRRQLEL